MALRDGAIEGVYRVKRRAWRDRVRRARARRDRPLVDARVLVRMDAGIGNAVEATPLVQAIRALWPRVHLTILPPPGDLFDGWCVADRIVPDAAALEGERFDATFLPWSTASDGPFDPGEVHRAQGLFPHWQLRPEREVNLDAVRRLGFDGATPPLYVSTKAPADPLPPAPPIIALVPGGKVEHRWRHKRWPHWHALASTLLARHPAARMVVVGGPGDAIDLPASERIVDLRGRHTLAETAWTLRQCALVVANDCGPAHIADAVLAPVLVLFGPTCEIKNGPRHRGVALSSDAACSPCQYDLALLDSCADPVCMLRLTADRVADAADRMLRGNPDEVPDGD